MRMFLIISSFAVSSLFAQDGQYDFSFASSAASFNPSAVGDQAQCVHVKEDGRILAGGTQYLGVNTECWVVQFMPDGNLDPAFGNNGTVLVNFCTSTDRLTALHSQPDGKVIAGGYESFNNALYDQGIVFRLTATGVLDDTWGLSGLHYVNMAPNDVQVRDIDLQADGKVLVAGIFYAGGGSQGASFAGSFRTANSTPPSEGMDKSSIDEPGVDYINSVIARDDGTVLVGGSLGADHVAYRYLSDGTLDPFFAVNGKLTGTLTTGSIAEARVVITSQGRLLFYGNGTGANARIAIKAYDADGALDPSFGTSSEVLYDLSVSSCTVVRGDLIHADRLAVPFHGPASKRFNVQCFNSDGSVASGFGSNGEAFVNWVNDASAWGAAAQGDTALVVLATRGSGMSSEPGMVRYQVADISTGTDEKHGSRPGAFPVPTKGTDVTLITGDRRGGGTVVVHDAWGRRIGLRTVQSDDRVLLVGSGVLTPGVYVASYRSVNNAVTIPFIVE
ncbi:MAG: hypothetical protein IPK99_17090 [Flavobacteriales bacterium]|nr:hypothetical protein [Flavobacteriales bacterium]